MVQVNVLVGGETPAFFKIDMILSSNLSTSSGVYVSLRRVMKRHTAAGCWIGANTGTSCFPWIASRRIASRRLFWGPLTRKPSEGFDGAEGSSAERFPRVLSTYSSSSVILSVSTKYTRFSSRRSRDVSTERCYLGFQGSDHRREAADLTAPVPIWPMGWSQAG